MKTKIINSGNLFAEWLFLTNNYYIIFKIAKNMILSISKITYVFYL